MGSKVLDPDGQRKDSFKTKISEPHKKISKSVSYQENKWMAEVNYKKHFTSRNCTRFQFNLICKWLGD